MPVVPARALRKREAVEQDIGRLRHAAHHTSPPRREAAGELQRCPAGLCIVSRLPSARSRPDGRRGGRVQAGDRPRAADEPEFVSSPSRAAAWTAGAWLLAIVALSITASLRPHARAAVDPLSARAATRPGHFLLMGGFAAMSVIAFAGRRDRGRGASRRRACWPWWRCSSCSRSARSSGCRIARSRWSTSPGASPASPASARSRAWRVARARASEPGSPPAAVHVERAAPLGRGGSLSARSCRRPCRRLRCARGSRPPRRSSCGCARRSRPSCWSWRGWRRARSHAGDLRHRADVHALAGRRELHPGAGAAEQRRRRRSPRYDAVRIPEPSHVSRIVLHRGG